MLNTSRILPSLLGAFALTLTVTAHADDAVTLARTFKAGTTFKYKSVTKVDANGMEVVLKRGEKLTVKEVKADGQVTIERVAGAGTMTLGGNDQEVPATPPVTETYDKAGKLTDFKMDHPDETFMTLPIQNLLAVSSHLLLPDKAVKSGDTWENQIDNPAVKGKKITIKGTFLGIEKKDGADTWKVKQTVEAETAADGTKLTVEETVFLDPTDGHELKTTEEAKGIPTVYGTLNWKLEAALNKDEDAPKKDTAAK